MDATPTTPEKLVSLLITLPIPALVLVKGEEVELAPLEGRHPLEVLASAPEGEGYDLVGFMGHGSATPLEGQGQVERVTIAYGASRTEAAAMMLTGAGVTSTPPPEGAIVDAFRAYLGAEPS